MKTLSPIKPLPFCYIGKEKTEARKKNFSETKHKILTSALKRPDTMSIWYSRDHIATLLEEIDHAKGNGLRLFFGAYEEGHEFAGQLCLVMNVTRERNTNGTPSNVNVILEEEPDFNQRSLNERDFNPDAPARPRDFNFGSPCPPRCE